MTSTQNELLGKRTVELEAILVSVEQMNFPKEWTNVFSTIALYRGFVSIKAHHERQMQNIVDVNSPSVMLLASSGKRAGLKMLNHISAGTDNEKVRELAARFIMDKGVKGSKRDVDLIMAAKPLPSLFDWEVHHS